MSKRYQIYRSEDKNNFELIGETKEKKFLDNTAPPKILYYKVRQMDGPLPGSFSNIFTIQLIDVVPPSIPVFDFADVTTSSITLHWNPSTDNTEVSYYRIFRSDGNSSSFSFINNSSQTTYTDFNLSSSFDYYYRLSAVDIYDNESEQSPEIPITTDNAPPTVPEFTFVSSSTSTITLNWNPSVDDVMVSYYSIYRLNENLNLFETIGTSSVTSYTDSDLTEDRFYYYKLSATDNEGAESDKSPQIDLNTVNTSFGTNIFDNEPTGSESTDPLEFSGLLILSTVQNLDLARYGIDTFDSQSISESFEYFSTGSFSNIEISYFNF